MLGCFGLSIRTKDVDLEDEFSRYGQVDKAVILYDQRTERSRGFGFVTMSNEEEAARCIDKLNGIELHGRNIRVAYSTTVGPHASTPGEYMGFKTKPRFERGRNDRDARPFDRERIDRYSSSSRPRDDERYSSNSRHRDDDRYSSSRRPERDYKDTRDRDRHDDRFDDRRSSRRDDDRDRYDDRGSRRRDDSPRRRSPAYDSAAVAAAAVA